MREVRESPLNEDQRKSFPVFVSSLCSKDDALRTLRSKLYYDVGRTNVVFIDEEVNGNRDIPQQDDLEVADELIVRIREAKAFVCILGGSEHGSPIRVQDKPSRVSFFEVELFQAALLNKDIYIFVRDDFTPGPRLQRLLEILPVAFPEWNRAKRLCANEILSGVEQVVDRTLSRQTHWPTFRQPIRKLTQALYAARARNRPNSAILFLDGEIEMRGEKPRLEVPQLLLQEIELQSNEEKRISRLWIGLREMMVLDPKSQQDPELLTCWSRLLAEWSRAGAWYGLHGDTPLGCLAALNSLAQVRNRLSSLRSGAHSSRDTVFPGGALASAKYSIAKRLYIAKDREARFNEALSDLKHSLDIEREDKSGLLAIRGSISRELGRVSDCIDDYEEVLRLRRHANAPANEIGQALSELGYGYLRKLSLRKGLRLCEAGVEGLRQGGRAGFLARGLRKLAIAYLANGRLRKAYEMQSEATAVAVKHGALDQL